MKTLALDTNAYSRFKRGEAGLVDELGRAERILISVPVLAKLRIGFRGGSRETVNLDELEQFLSSPRVEICPMTEQTAILYAEIFGTLQRKGTPIPLNDIWIAASAMEQGAILLSADTHFARIDGLLLNIPL
jgi:tRNA(fMet)-specific endonuclease VapC